MRVYVKIVYVYSIIYKSVCVCERVRFLSVCECVVCLIPNCTSVQLYNYTTIHLHNCKATQLYKRANTQLYDCTTEKLYDRTSGYTNIQLYTTASYRSMQPHNYTTVNEAEPQGNSAALLHQKETTGEWLHLDLVHCRSLRRWSKDGEDGEAVNGIQSVRPGRPQLLLQCPMSAYQGAPPNGWIKERQLKRGRKTQGTKSMKRGKQQKRDRKEMKISQWWEETTRKIIIWLQICMASKNIENQKYKFFHSSLSPSFKSSNVNFGLTPCEVHTPLRGTGKVECQQKQVAVWSVILAQESSIEHGCVCVYSFLCMCVCVYSFLCENIEKTLWRKKKKKEEEEDLTYKMTRKISLNASLFRFQVSMFLHVSLVFPEVLRADGRLQQRLGEFASVEETQLRLNRVESS